MTGHFLVPPLLFLHLLLFYSSCSQQTGLFSPPCSRSGGMLVYLYIKTCGPSVFESHAQLLILHSLSLSLSLASCFCEVTVQTSGSVFVTLLLILSTSVSHFSTKSTGYFNTKLKSFCAVLSTAAEQEDYANRIDVGKHTGKPTVYSPQLKKSQSDGPQCRMEAQATEQGDDTSC